MFAPKFRARYRDAFRFQQVLPSTREAPRRFMRHEPQTAERLPTRSARFGILVMVILVLLNYDMSPWESHKGRADVQGACRQLQNVGRHTCMIRQGLWSHIRVEKRADDTADKAEDCKRTWLNLSEVVDTRDWHVQVVLSRSFFTDGRDHSQQPQCPRACWETFCARTWAPLPTRP